MGRNKKNKPKNPKKYSNGKHSKTSKEMGRISSRFEELEDELIGLVKTIYLTESTNFSSASIKLHDEAINRLGIPHLEEILKKTKQEVIIRVFSEDRDPTVLMHIAANSNTPDEVLDRLSRQAMYLEGAVANNPAASTITLLSINRYSDSIENRQDAADQLGKREAVVETKYGIQYFDPIEN